MISFDFSSPNAEKTPILLPLFSEDTKRPLRKALFGLTRLQKRSVQKALRSPNLPKSGTLPIFSNEPVVILQLIEKKKKFFSREAREAGENAFHLLKRYDLTDLSIAPGALKGGLVSAYREGVLLGSYDFNRWKGKKKGSDEEKNKKKLEKIIFLGEKDKAEKLRLEIMTEAVEFTRDLINIPPDIATPSYLAKKSQEFGKSLPKVTTTILGEKELEKLECYGITTVGRGSEEESRLIILEYKGGGKEAPIALVGKGVTYDTGGLSLKPSRAMHTMKQDLGGGATVLGAFWAIAKSKVKKNVLAVVPTVENLITAKSYKPDDIITMYNGLTVEVTNTDAEGRLILADALSYIEETRKPRVILDLATLTGACAYAVGNDFTALLTLDRKLATSLQKSAAAVDEPIWELPLHERYKSYIESPIADIVNSSATLKPGTIEAGLFLQHFVSEKTPWGHMDIASVAYDDVKGMATGRNVRLLWDFVENY